MEAPIFDFRYLQDTNMTHSDGGNASHHLNGTQRANHTVAEPYESKITCVWEKDDFYATASAKKGVSASLFILFLIYTILVIIRSYKKGTGVSIHIGFYHKFIYLQVGPKLHRIVNEMAYSHIFFFISTILCHILTPKAFPVILIYVYMILLAIEVFASMLEN